jgi:hypothetical protein
MATLAARAEGAAQQRPDQLQAQAAHDIRPLLVLAGVISAGLATVVAYALPFLASGQGLSVATVGLMGAGASLMLGGLLGFLFGIPRTLQGERPADAADADRPRGDWRGVAYQPNTNLEQISDWLTKILVGVGLTQVGNLAGYLQATADFFARGLGDSEVARTFAVMILLYFSVGGFLFGFLWTRLFLAGEFVQADVKALQALDRRVEELAEISTQAVEASRQVEKKVEEQADIDAKALALVYRQLDVDAPPIPQPDLDAAIGAASPAVKVQIFSLTSTIRKENWKDPQTKRKMERTIPIFRALLASDPERFHRNYAQLGFALKDQREPDWAEAEAILTRAIELRDQGGEQGYVYYEFNRALCRIMQDQQFLRQQPSSPETRDAILADLRVAVAGGWRRAALTDPTTKAWLDGNGVQESDLT